MALNSLGLLALALPDNIEHPLLTLQKECFHRLGLLSALALPPLIPLLWTREPLLLEAVRRVAKEGPCSVEISQSVPRLLAGTLALPVALRSPEGDEPATPPLQRLILAARREAQADGNQEVEGLFTIDSGIYLASSQGIESESLSASPPALGDIPAASRAVTLRSSVIVYGERTQWWRNVSCATVAARRLVVTTGGEHRFRR